MDTINRIAQENNLLIMEGFAKGLESKYKRRTIGTFGITDGTYSFYSAKVLGY